MRMRQRPLVLSLCEMIVILAIAAPAFGKADDPAPPAERSNGMTMYIVGSTLIAPYLAAITDRLIKNAGLRPAVIVNKGSTRGVDAFCAGNGIETPDILAISRRIRSVELDNCAAHGVTDIIEIQLGYDAAAIVSRKDDQDYPLKLSALYRAIAADLPRDYGDFIPNRYSRWQEVDPALPNTEIKFIIPVPSLGGRAFMEDNILQSACRAIPEIKTIFNAAARLKQCNTLRGDHRIIELDAPYDRAVAQAMSSAPPGTLAIMPLRFASEYQDLLKLQPLDGVTPSYETISNRKYRFIRPLYILIKKSHVKNYWGRGPVFGLREFITEATREATLGPGGYLTKIGLFPLDQESRDLMRESSLHLTIIDR